MPVRGASRWGNPPQGPPLGCCARSSNSLLPGNGPPCRNGVGDVIVISGVLLLVAVVFLIIGLFGPLAWVYASIGVSVLSFAFLLLGVRRRRVAPVAATGAAPALPTAPTATAAPAAAGLSRD